MILNLESAAMNTPNSSILPGTAASRRQFLKTASLAVAAAGVGVRAWGQTSHERIRTADAADATLASRLGIASYSFREFSLDKTLAMTRRLRIKYLCLKSDHLPLNAKPEQLRLAAAKVKEQGITLYAGGGIAMQSRAEVEQAFEYAKHAGLRIMVIMPTAKTLPLVVEKVKEYDVPVAIHNHGPGDKHFPTPGSVYDKIKDLDPRIGMCVDVGHTVRYGDDVYAALERCGERVYDLHLKDVTAATAKGQTTVLGRGVIDLPRLFRVLRKIDYQGILSFEHESDAKDPLPSVAESAGYARGFLAGLEGSGNPAS
jgi:inosose dehydratase